MMARIWLSSMCIWLMETWQNIYQIRRTCASMDIYGHPNETWEVTLLAEEVLPELPEPVLGINFARNGMNRRDWLSLVAVHSDSWLLSVAFYLGAHLNRNERKRLFGLINDLPTVFEVVTERKPVKDKPTADSGSKSMGTTKVTVVLSICLFICFFCGWIIWVLHFEFISITDNGSSIPL